MATVAPTATLSPETTRPAWVQLVVKGSTKTRQFASFVLVVGCIVALGPRAGYPSLSWHRPVAAAWAWDQPEMIREGTIEYRGMGAYNALAFDGDGNPAVAYTDRDDEVLRFATPNGNGWDRTVVDSRNSGTGLDLAYGPDGPAISYGRSQARFAELQADGSWKLSVVDRGGALGTALAFDPDGNPWVLFNQPPRTTSGPLPPQRLVVAHRENGRWILEEITSAPYVYMGDIAFLGDTLLVVYGVDNDGDGPSDELHLSERAAGLWRHELVVGKDSTTRCSAGQRAQVAFDAVGTLGLIHVASNCQDGSYLEFVRDSGGGWTFDTIGRLEAADDGLAYVGDAWLLAVHPPRAKSLYLAVRSALGEWHLGDPVVEIADLPRVGVDRDGNPARMEPYVGSTSFALGPSGRLAYALEVVRFVFGSKAYYRGMPVPISDLRFAAAQ